MMEPGSPGSLKRPRENITGYTGALKTHPRLGLGIASQGYLRQPWKKKAPPRSLNLERVARDTPPMKIGGVVEDTKFLDP